MNPRIPLLLALSSLTLSAVADYSEDLTFDSNNDEESTTDVYASQTPASSSASNAMYFASARPDLSSGYGLIISGEFLYWKAEEEGLYYGLRSPNFTTNPPNSTTDHTHGVKGKVSRVNPDYQAGYRLGATLQIPYDRWDISCVWTRYQSDKKDQIRAKPPEVTFPYWLNQFFFPLPRSAKAKWTLNFNSLDFDVGRAFFLGEHFSLKPFAGFKAAWIEQDLLVRYADVTFSQGATTSGIQSKNRIDFQGYGMNLGLDAKWNFGAGFSFFSTCSAAILWGNFDTAHFEKTFFNAPRNKLLESVQIGSPQIQMIAGVNWESHFKAERFYLNIHAGWEEQIWFNQNQFNRYTDAFALGRTKHEFGALTLSGLTVGASLGF